MKQPASYRVLKFSLKVTLRLPYHVSYDMIPERKVRSDEMSDALFDAIVEVVKASKCEWCVYTVNKEMVESSADRKKA